MSVPKTEKPWLKPRYYRNAFKLICFLLLAGAALILLSKFFIAIL